MNDLTTRLAEQAWNETAVSKDFGHPTAFAEHLIKLVAQRCISQVAGISMKNFENDDITWACDRIIHHIQTDFEITTKEVK